MNTSRNFLFKLFLVAYASILLLHVKRLDLVSWLSWGALVSGLAVAVLAHSRLGCLTIILLVGHISIEWIEHARHGWSYSTEDVIFHGVHALMDFAFLFGELRRLLPKWSKHVLIGVVSMILIIFCSFRQPPPSNPYLKAILVRAIKHSCQHGGFPTEALIVGGMFGCVACHMCRRSA